MNKEIKDEVKFTGIEYFCHAFEEVLKVVIKFVVHKFDKSWTRNSSNIGNFHKINPCLVSDVSSIMISIELSPVRD